MARTAVESPTNAVVVSPATVSEIAIKVTVAKLEIPTISTGSPG